MSRPDLSRLSPPDLEDLVRDLLAAEWGRPVESFRGGRDGGVDLRCATLDGGTIIQCKHFTSGLTKLRAHLKTNELPKIRRLSPARYVLATSVAMNPSNKDALVADLAPYIRSTDDIIAYDDLAAMLRDNPRVERAHYKLWLTSTAVLERVVHAAELCQTEFALERIERKLPLFVQTPAYIEARRLLDENRTLVIVGPPGVGKTTLAEIILYEHVARGYEPVVIQTNPAEGRKFYRRGQPQIFYFDDFLGQAYLGENSDFSGRNQDASMRDFFEMIRGAEHARFLLTTRDHILSSALNRSERLRHSGISELKRVLRITDYSFASRVRILFNHLYFSDLPQAHINALIEADAPVAIARHDHFNPRLIEWLSSRQRLSHVDAAAYPKHVTDLLENPEIIWRHAFEEEISFEGRSVLLAAYTLGNEPFLEDLEDAWTALNQVRSRRYNVPSAPNAFRTALKELEGAFLDFPKGRAVFINPSVRDYLASAIAASADHTDDLLHAIVRSRQLSTLNGLAEERPETSLKAIIAASLATIAERIPVWWERDHLHWVNEPGGHRGYHVDLTLLERLELLITLAEANQNDALAGDAARRGCGAIQATDIWNEMSGLVSLIEEIASSRWFVERHGKALLEEAKTFAFDAFERHSAEVLFWLLRSHARAPDAWSDDDRDRMWTLQRQYEEDGALEEIESIDDVDALEELQSTLQLLSKEFGLQLAREISKLDDEIAERSRPARREPDRDDDYDRSSAEIDEKLSDDDVRDFFSSLKR